MLRTIFKEKNKDDYADAHQRKAACFAEVLEFVRDTSIYHDADIRFFDGLTSSEVEALEPVSRWVDRIFNDLALRVNKQYGRFERDCYELEDANNLPSLISHHWRQLHEILEDDRFLIESCVNDLQVTIDHVDLFHAYIKKLLYPLTDVKVIDDDNAQIDHNRDDKITAYLYQCIMTLYQDVCFYYDVMFASYVYRGYVYIIRQNYVRINSSFTPDDTFIYDHPIYYSSDLKSLYKQWKRDIDLMCRYQSYENLSDEEVKRLKEKLYVSCMEEDYQMMNQAIAAGFEKMMDYYVRKEMLGHLGEYLKPYGITLTYHDGLLRGFDDDLFTMEEDRTVTLFAPQKSCVTMAMKTKGESESALSFCYKVAKKSQRLISIDADRKETCDFDAHDLYVFLISRFKEIKTFHGFKEKGDDFIS